MFYFIMVNDIFAMAPNLYIVFAFQIYVWFVELLLDSHTKILHAYRSNYE